MRFSKLTWFGIVVFVIPIVVFGGWDIWLQTRNCRPIYMPVQMTIGHVRTLEFTINLGGRYTIEIESKKQIPFETLNCLLGSSMPFEKCERPSVVKANWVLTHAGKAVESGTTASDDGGSWTKETVAREMGTFQGQRGRRYVLDVDFAADGSALSPTDPHLKVEVHPGFYEGAMFESYYLRAKCEEAALVGLSLLVISTARFLWQRRRSRSVSSFR